MARAKKAARQIADYFLNWVEQGEESGEALTNLKMQKLAYYTQGLALAILGRPMFKEEIQAWFLGPVVPDLFWEYKGKGFERGAPITPPRDYCAHDHFSKEEIKVLDEVFDEYGRFSASKLCDMAHAEPPWQDAWNGGKGQEAVITHESLKRYFSAQFA